MRLDSFPDARERRGAAPLSAPRLSAQTETPTVSPSGRGDRCSLAAADWRDFQNTHTAHAPPVSVALVLASPLSGSCLHPAASWARRGGVSYFCMTPKLLCESRILRLAKLSLRNCLNCSEKKKNFQNFSEHLLN